LHNLNKNQITLRKSQCYFFVLALQKKMIVYLKWYANMILYEKGKIKRERLNKRPEIIVFLRFIYREQFYGR